MYLNIIILNSGGAIDRIRFQKILTSKHLLQCPTIGKLDDPDYLELIKTIPHTRASFKIQVCIFNYFPPLLSIFLYNSAQN